MVLVPTEYATKGIESSMAYTTLNINICKVESLYTNISEIWIYWSLVIINKLNIIHLGFLAKIDK